jgi:cysteinyl-tRNA synthetase
MPLKIYNTMKRKKEPFTPLQEGKVGMYVCGVTVYDFSHIGHARAMVVFDVIQHYLRYRGYDVTYVRNYTDIDDKIINRANEESVPFNVISERYIKEFDSDMESLGIEKPTHIPRATQHIQDMISMIEILLEKGKAYEIDGDVYFDVSQFSEYGKLSGKDIDSLLPGARIEVDERKKDPLDFALWKKSKQGEPFWESPWGKGRPGWHIECSAMSQKYLGDTFDIHGGGMDLVFPHHENEIAQAESATGKQFVRYWIHNGFVNIDKEKMSKSLKNFLNIREVLKTYHPEVIRLFLLSNHYRSPVDFSKQNLIEAKTGLDRFYAFLNDLQNLDSFSKEQEEIDAAEKKAREELTAFPEKFKEAMDDDFNTAAAIGHLYSLTRTLNSLIDRKKKDPSFKVTSDTVLQAQEVFNEAGSVFGLFQESPLTYFENQKKTRLASLGITEEEIEKLIAERARARKAEDWKTADAVRNSLAEKGVILKDTPQGTQWSFKDN